jgi:RHS repeat-associated protein
VVWTPPLPAPDTYDVYAWWPAFSSNAGNARFTITHEGGSETVTVDRRANSHSWQLLGTFEMDPAAGHKVSLSDRADGNLAADAILFRSKVGGERVARWEGTVTGSGTYQVWAKWPAASSHSPQATYRIATPAGTQSVAANQQLGGGQWHLLGTATLAANDDWTVELSDQSPGEVVADAIAVTPPISLSDRFEWAPSLPAAGEYAIYAKWQADPSRASDAVYEIAHDGGVAQVTVDQTRDGGEWRYLGTWSLDPANGPKVALLASLTGTLSADAIRFVAGDAIGGDVAYAHADQLGTIQKLTDAAGALAWDRTARPFGETVSISAASGIAQLLRFPGQYADETGLSYNYFRDYDPTLGRYVQSDPIGLLGGINTYAYVGGNPLTFVDARGLQAGAVIPRPVWPSIPGIRV